MERYVKNQKTGKWTFYNEYWDYPTESMVKNAIQNYSESGMKLAFKLSLHLDSIKPDIVAFGYFPLKEKFITGEKSFEYRIYYMEMGRKTPIVLKFKSIWENKPEMKLISGESLAREWCQDRYTQKDIDFRSKEFFSEDFLAW